MHIDVLCMFTGVHCGMYVRVLVVEVQPIRHRVLSSAPEDTHVRMHVPHGSLLASNAVKAAAGSAAFATPISSVIVHTPVDKRGAACHVWVCQRRSNPRVGMARHGP